MRRSGHLTAVLTYHRIAAAHEPVAARDASAPPRRLRPRRWRGSRAAGARSRSPTFSPHAPEGAPLRRDAVLVTFDDALRRLRATLAWPVLRALGIARAVRPDGASRGIRRPRSGGTACTRRARTAPGRCARRWGRSSSTRRAARAPRVPGPARARQDPAARRGDGARRRRRRAGRRRRPPAARVLALGRAARAGRRGRRPRPAHPHAPAPGPRAGRARGRRGRRIARGAGARVGRAAPAFAYPPGASRRRRRPPSREAGHRVAFTTRRGAVDLAAAARCDPAHQRRTADSAARCCARSRAAIALAAARERRRAPRPPDGRRRQAGRGLRHVALPEDRGDLHPHRAPRAGAARRARRDLPAAARARWRSCTPKRAPSSTARTTCRSSRARSWPASCTGCGAGRGRTWRAADVVRGTAGSLNFFVGGLAIFPKVAHGARLMQADGVVARALPLRQPPGRRRASSSAG